MKDNELTQNNGVVIIKPVDLNEFKQEESTEVSSENLVFEERKTFSEDVYSNLPELLQVPCSKFCDKDERDTFFVGALGLASGVLPNVQGMYFVDEVKPNLYCFILGKYGIGKGYMKLAKKLLIKIHDNLKDQYKHKSAEYKTEYSTYQKQKKQYENNELDSCPDEPVAPPKQKLFLPANNSGTGFKQVLNDCGGRGIMLESEGDTLANILKHDYGNYSDDLRRAFHNETIAYSRRTGNEDVEIENPCLSVVISSTYDQLIKLIPSVENGLFSRFVYFEISPNRIFKNPFKRDDKVLLNTLNDYSEFYLLLYQRLHALNRLIIFKLREEQEVAFVQIFQEWKNYLSTHVSEDLEGFVNRLGNICFRICMLLSVLRIHDKIAIPEQIFCTHQDFENALRIVDVFKWQAVNVYLRLPEPTNFEAQANSIESQEHKIETMKKCLLLRSQGASIGDIAFQVFGSRNFKSKVWRILNAKKHE